MDVRQPSEDGSAMGQAYERQAATRTQEGQEAQVTQQYDPHSEWAAEQQERIDEAYRLERQRQTRQPYESIHPERLAALHDLRAEALRAPEKLTDLANQVRSSPRSPHDIATALERYGLLLKRLAEEAR